MRRAVFRKLLKEDFKFYLFSEEDRLNLILNGLKDPDEQVVKFCK